MCVQKLDLRERRSDVEATFLLVWELVPAAHTARLVANLRTHNRCNWLLVD
jgi:hypothetical protein